MAWTLHPQPCNVRSRSLGVMPLLSLAIDPLGNTHGMMPTRTSGPEREVGRSRAELTLYLLVLTRIRVNGKSKSELNLTGFDVHPRVH